MGNKNGSPAFQDDKIDLLVYWLHEREKIRKAKERGEPKPWTADPLLSSYRWCCPRRSQDAVSHTLLTRWYSHHTSPGFTLAAATLARMVNWPEALLEATDGAPLAHHHMPRMRERLASRAARGDKVFTGAFVVPGVPGKSKVDSVMDLVEHVFRHGDELFRESTKATWSQLLKLNTCGSFLGGQIVADVALLPQGEVWRDRLTWAPIGPGSMRGMNRCLGRPKSTTISQEQFEVLLSELVARIEPRIVDLQKEMPLRFADFQSLLCEGDKYLRLMRNEGQVRARYDGQASPAEVNLSLFD